jgi:hypothetical protein
MSLIILGDERTIIKPFATDCARLLPSIGNADIKRVRSLG